MTADDPSLDQLRRAPLPLRGRAALVTGVSRRAGIGYAVARRLAALGASLFLHHYAPHDRDQPWGDDPGGTEAVLAGARSALAATDASIHHLELDLALPEAPARLIEAAADAFGHLDILVCNHARSGDSPLGTLDAALLDAHWAVNTRSTILLTSGQDLGPMTGEIAYAASKGALASITKTLADQLADQEITLNAVNPGPVDTGYAPPVAYEAVRRHFPQQRWGVPDDPARLIAWLVTDEAAWITGQVINSEGGFRRWA